MIRTITLDKLVASPRNVRRHVDPAADLELKTDIAARGLLQNLVVTPVTKPRSKFAVEAGERRRRALLALAGEGKLDHGFEVPCLVLEPAEADALEASLAENFQRLAMNPADECVAFQRLIAAGADAEGVARRFGLTVRFVEGRLRLADLAPIVFEALGAGEITLDVAKAYAATPDRERQAWVFEQLGVVYAHPDSIRRMMTQATASATDRRAKFVGEEAYVAAGGRIERDLFWEDAATRWLDVPLLERLALEKLAASADHVAAEQGLAFVRPTLDNWVGHGLTADLEHVPVEIAPLTDEEGERIDALEGEIETFVPVLEDDEATDEARAAAETEIETRNRAIRAIVEKPPVLAPEVRATAGTFLLLGDDGSPRLYGAYYREPVETDTEEQAGKGDAGAPETSRSADGGSPGQRQEPSAPERPVLSQRLRDELSMQRRDILAASVAARPDVAIDLAIFLMVDPEVRYSPERLGSALIARHPSDPVMGFKTPDAPATIALARMAEALDRSWTAGETRAERFDAFRTLSDEAKAAWLAFAVSWTLEASLGGGGAGCPFHDHLADLLEIDVASCWRPTGANWFDKVSKVQALEALTEIGGPVFAARYAKAKKVELSETCARIFAGAFIGEVEVKQAAMAWVPEVMRFAAPLPDEGSGDAVPAESPSGDVDQVEASRRGDTPVGGDAANDQETPSWEDGSEPESGVSAGGDRVGEAA